MHRVVGNIEEEGLVVVSVDKVDGFARDSVGEVFLFLDRLTAAHDRVVGVVVGLVTPQVW